MAYDYKLTTIAEVLKRFLKTIDQDDINVDVFESADSPGYYINFRKYMNLRSLTDMEQVFGSFRDFIETMKESPLTKDFRNKIALQEKEINNLKKENRELVDRVLHKNIGLAKFVNRYYTRRFNGKVKKKET